MAPKRSLGHALGIPFRRSRGATIAPIPPNIITATVEDETPTKIYINFAWNLDDTSVPDPSAFTLTGKTISGVVITGATITLTVTVAYVYGDVITVDYTMPVVDPLKQESTGASILSWVGWVVTNYVHTPEVSTYIDGLITPLSDGQLALLNTMIVNWKAGLVIDNLSDAFDVLYDLAGETAESSLRNMVRRAHDGVAVNSPTFTPLEGWAGDGVSSYINTNYNPSANGLKYTINNASIGVYSRTDFSGSFSDTGGRTSGTANSVYFYTRNATLSIRFHTATFAYGVNSNSLGMHIASRVDIDNVKLYKNGNDLGNTAATVSAMPAVNYFIHCNNNAGVPSIFSSRQLSLVFYGRSVILAEVVIITNTFEAYMDANERGVI